MKKLLAILGMITCMIGLTACGSVQEAPEGAVSEADALALGQSLVESAWQIVNAGEEETAATEVAYNGVLNFKSALGDIGNYMGTDGGTVEYKDDEVIVNINVLGSSHNAVVEFILNNSGTELIGMTTNVTYSFGENMAKAALNTLLGMGTVFAVLILISLIISAFGLIPKLFEKKKEPEKASTVQADKVVAQIVETEELSDDLELVAVISAAIAAYEGAASGSTDGFVVRSIRKAYKK